MLPKGINQYSFNWGSVTMTAMDSPCPGYKVSDRYHARRFHIIRRTGIGNISLL